MPSTNADEDPPTVTSSLLQPSRLIWSEPDSVLTRLLELNPSLCTTMTEVGIRDSLPRPSSLNRLPMKMRNVLSEERTQIAVGAQKFQCSQRYHTCLMQSSMGS